MTYLGVEAFYITFKVTKTLEDGYDNVYQSAFAFMRNGLDRYHSVFKYDATTEDLFPYYDKLRSVEKTINDLVFAIQLGCFIGTSIAVVAVFINIFWLLFDYKRRVLQARMGVFEFKREKIPLKATAALPGAIISNSIFIFFVMIFVCTIVFSILAWPLFWQILWKIKWSLVSILSGTIINFLIKLIMNKLCYNFDSIKRRGLLSIFDFFLLQIAILAGIISSISRFGIL